MESKVKRQILLEFSAATSNLTSSLSHTQHVAIQRTWFARRPAEMYWKHISTAWTCLHLLILFTLALFPSWLVSLSPPQANLLAKPYKLPPTGVSGRARLCCLSHSLTLSQRISGDSVRACALNNLILRSQNGWNGKCRGPQQGWPLLTSLPKSD